MHVCLRVCERVCVRLCVCVSVTHLGVGVEAAVDAHRQDLMCVCACVNACCFTMVVEFLYS